MKNTHILNFKKTKYVFSISVILTLILVLIIITETKPNQSVAEFKTILSFLMPGILAMLSIYVSGMAIMIGTLRADFIKKLSGENKENVKTVISTFSYASKTAAVLFLTMFSTYLLLSINYSLGLWNFIIITSICSIVIIYTLLFLIQFTVYLVSIIIKIYEISLLN